MMFAAIKRRWKRRPRIHREGIWFPHGGDEVIWLWPWKRKRRHLRYLSIGFSGTGEFGDALYTSLKELDAEWEEFIAVMQPPSDMVEQMFGLEELELVAKARGDRTFQIGDGVRLNSGGPEMEILGWDEQGKMICAWGANEDTHIANFSPECLTLIREARRERS